MSQVRCGIAITADGRQAKRRQLLIHRAARSLAMQSKANVLPIMMTAPHVHAAHHNPDNVDHVPSCNLGLSRDSIVLS